MRHPTDGILRRLLDEPSAVADADRAPVQGCHTCLTRLAHTHHDALRAAAALSGATPPAGLPEVGALAGGGVPEVQGASEAWLSRAETEVDVDGGWRRLSATLAADTPGPVVAASRPSRWRAALRSPVIAVVGVLALVTA